MRCDVDTVDGRVGADEHHEATRKLAARLRGTVVIDGIASLPGLLSERMSLLFPAALQFSMFSPHHVGAQTGAECRRGRSASRRRCGIRRRKSARSGQALAVIFLHISVEKLGPETWSSR
jgi:hypothetical protein